MKNTQIRKLAAIAFVAGFLALTLWPDRWIWVWSGTFPLPVPIWYSLSALGIKSYTFALWLIS